MEQEKKSWFEIICRVINLEGLFMTGKYLMMLVLGAISINYIIEFGINFNLPSNPIPKVIILCSVVLIPIYLSYITMIEIFGEDK